MYFAEPLKGIGGGGFPIQAQIVKTISTFCH